MTASDVFDFGVLLFLTFGTLWSFIRGGMNTLMYVISPLAGYAAACKFGDQFREMAGWSSAPVMGWLAWFIVLAAVGLLVNGVLTSIETWLKKRNLSSWNHLMGLILGFVLTLIISWLISYGLIHFDSFRPMVTQSRSAKYLLRLAEIGKQTLPETPQTEGEEAQSVYRMSNDFAERVQEEQAKHPTAPSSQTENTGIPHLLDEVDKKLEPIFVPSQPKEEQVPAN